MQELLSRRVRHESSCLSSSAPAPVYRAPPQLLSINRTPSYRAAPPPSSKAPVYRALQLLPIELLPIELCSSCLSSSCLSSSCLLSSSSTEQRHRPTAYSTTSPTCHEPAVVPIRSARPSASRTGQPPSVTGPLGHACTRPLAQNSNIALQPG